MRVLIDTNVMLDVLLDRDPWVAGSSAVWQANDEGQIVGYITACAIADIFYIVRRLTTLETARADVIVTRDKSGFEAAAMPVLTPAELLMQLGE